MQKSVLDNRKKLIPLRKLAKQDVYSTAYLSQLVQRKKLKAEKIGRNYFTTEEWFEEYLDAYACDEKREMHEKLLNKRQNNPAKINSIAAVIIAAVFVLLVLGGLYLNKHLDGQGQVAGVSEYSTSTLIK